MFAHRFAHEFNEDDRSGFGRFGGARMGRGMIEAFILRTLLEKPMHGYEVISSLEERSHGFWRPSAGSVYPTLQLLDEKGLVTVSDVDGKKVYTLTEAGREEAKHADSFDEHWGREWHDKKASLKAIKDLRENLGAIMRDVHEVYRHGTEAQRKSTTEMIEKLRDELHTIVSNKTESRE